MMSKQNELPEVHEVSPSCTSCFFNKRCAAYIAALKIIEEMNLKFGPDGLNLLKKVAWKAEDIAKECPDFLSIIRNQIDR